jgi:hypothetical protein
VICIKGPECLKCETSYYALKEHMWRKYSLGCIPDIYMALEQICSLFKTSLAYSFPELDDVLVMKSDSVSV